MTSYSCSVIEKKMLLNILNETKGTNAVKWHMNCGIQFVKYDKDGNKQDTVGFFTSRCVIKLLGEDRDMLNASID